MEIKIEYILDNDAWSEEEFQDAKDKIFIITEGMIEDLIYQNEKLENGDYIHTITQLNKYE